MAAIKRKKGFSIKFNLTVTGLLGVGVVCFCIFLWMFLLGIWAGQTVLTAGKYEATGVRKTELQSPPPATKKPVVQAPKAVPHPSVKKQAKKQEKQKKLKVVARREPAKAAPEPEEDPSFFAVQVAAFKDSGLAAEAIKTWKKKGYDVFSRPPEGADDKFTRVYIGRFDSMGAAKKQAGSLEKKEKIKPFIVLVPAD
ncbi:MAG: SPOR domain-containing protein [Thermodesulfobacteriota bacterium]